MSKDLRVAIFGARGFIAKEFIRRIPRGYELFLFSRPEADVKKPESFRVRLKEIKPDVVVNFSAKTGSLISSVPVLDMFETNTMGCLNVAYEAREVGAKSYIFTSSVVVHGENNTGEHHNRFSLFHPKHPYGASKASAEHALEQFVKEGDMNIVTLRPSQVIGEETSILQIPVEFVQNVLQGKEIQIFGKGLHEREYVSVKDVALGIWKAIEWSMKAEKGYHPFFLTGNRISMKDLAEKVVKKFGGKVTYIPSTKQTFSLTTDPSESKIIFGWEAHDDLDSILADVAYHDGFLDRKV